MSTITVQEAQSRLAEIIASLPPGEEIILTQNTTPVATLRASSIKAQPCPRKLGTLKGSVIHMAADFDAIPEGFEEYTTRPSRLNGTSGR